ncbi:hypothetical protein [Filimonas effusa]|uniref:Peptidase S74 domain-containing protein n=1 Tax=Filimonas effusa TaxID=2508721 RepID=A0A4Q1D9A0_9BACT|nr:hypothetical protein [Filimonas effusa]RXK85952.1 hypothetical protein ESB13_03845 [Filimonas effusa]
MKRFYLALPVCFISLATFSQTQLHTEKINISGPSGNVKLHISGNDASYTGADLLIRRYGTNIGVGKGAAIQLEDSSATLNSHIIQGSAAGIQFFNGLAETGSWTEHMRITMDGNVGIGTISPAHKLDVNGDARFSGNIRSVLSTAEGGALFLDNNSKSGSDAATWAIYNMTGGWYGNALQFWRYRADNKEGMPALKLWDDGNAEFLGGIISAGQTVAHAGFVSGTSNAEGFHMSHNGAFISGWNSTNTVRTGYLQFIAGSDVRLDAENGARLSFRTNGHERMKIEENGNIGIGTEASSYKLAVDGTIGARKIKITQEAWPDYVFDSSYQLPSLTHVETFIKANKHLPEVPPATEVKTNGLDLGDNQAILLKKIEELTLYIIQQNKQINDQNTQIIQQNKQVAQQNAQIIRQTEEMNQVKRRLAELESRL